MHEGVGPKTAQRILDELATSRITIKAEPDQQPEFKHHKLGPLFYLLYELQKKKYTSIRNGAEEFMITTTIYSKQTMMIGISEKKI